MSVRMVVGLCKPSVFSGRKSTPPVHRALLDFPRGARPRSGAQRPLPPDDPLEIHDPALEHGWLLTGLDRRVRCKASSSVSGACGVQLDVDVVVGAGGGACCRSLPPA